MKKVEAIIRSSAIDQVVESLKRRGVGNLILTQALGHGASHGFVESYRGAQHRVDWSPRLRLEVLVSDAEAGPTAHTIAEAVRCGRDFDAVVTIVPIQDTIRVQSPERESNPLRAGGSEDVPRLGVMEQWRLIFGRVSR